MLFILDILRQPCVDRKFATGFTGFGKRFNDHIGWNAKNGDGKEESACYRLYSLVIPGAGEFTTENYTKSAIFLSVEATLLVAATIIYNNKSNNQFNVFENYANANWSIDRYAEWINNHGSD